MAGVGILPYTFPGKCSAPSAPQTPSPNFKNLNKNNLWSLRGCVLAQRVGRIVHRTTRQKAPTTKCCFWFAPNAAQLTVLNWVSSCVLRARCSSAVLVAIALQPLPSRRALQRPESPAPSAFANTSAVVTAAAPAAATPSLAAASLVPVRRRRNCFPAFGRRRSGVVAVALLNQSATL